MKKIALVTGASSGIGLEISKKLLNLGYNVLGVARNFNNTSIDNPSFKKLEFDLTNFSQYESFFKPFKNSQDFYILINCAGIGLFGLHEELKIKNLLGMLNLNFISPILLTNIFLRDLKKNKGFIFNISSITALQDSPLASAYSASKAGLSHFGNSLFAESRKSGIKVVNLHLDITSSSFYKNNWFKESEDPESYLNPTEIANTIEFILSQRISTVFTNITIKPSKHKINKN